MFQGYAVDLRGPEGPFFMDHRCDEGQGDAPVLY